MNIAIDTNVYSGFMRGDSVCVSTLRLASGIAIPLIVLAELRAGFAVGSRSSKNERVLEQFLTLPRVSLVIPDQSTTVSYAEIFESLRRRGTPIPTNDIWIAALAIQHDLALFSLDAHFDHVPHLLRA